MPELDKLIDLPPTKEEVYVFTRTPAFVCLSVCLLARLLKMRAWIWMKCCVSTDVKTWTNWLTFEPDPDYSPDPGTGFTSDFWILAGSIAAGAWANWLGFELDPDQSPHLGTGFIPDLWILEGYLKKLWTDFVEILCVDSCGGLHDLVRFWSASGSEFGSLNRIYTGFLIFSGTSEEVMDKFWWNLVGR